MQGHRRPLAWWYWYASAVFLTAWALGWAGGAVLALALAGWQIVHYSWRLDSLSSPAVQLRVAHFGLLVLGAVWPVLIATQLVLVWALVLFGERRRKTRVRWRAA